MSSSAFQSSSKIWQPYSKAAMVYDNFKTPPKKKDNENLILMNLISFD